MFATKSAVFAELQFIGRCPLIFCRRVISSFALSTCKGNDYSHRSTPIPLFNNIADHTGANGASAFAYRKT
jgi:hypothetical protein